MERKALRRELLDRELDGAVAVATRALDRDRLLRELLDREVGKRRKLALDDDRPRAPLERVDPEQRRRGSGRDGAAPGPAGVRRRLQETRPPACTQRPAKALAAPAPRSAPS